MKKKRNARFLAGAAMLLLGVSVLAVFGHKRISREITKHRLLKTCVVLEIPAAEIRVPVVEGTDGENLHVAAGHFIGKGEVGKGNFCLAGHNSTIYAEIFNTLSRAKPGDAVYLTDIDEAHTRYTYEISEIRLVEPTETWVLQDYGDDRITLITCTDDGTKRQVFTGLLRTGT